MAPLPAPDSTPGRRTLSLPRAHNRHVPAYGEGKTSGHVCLRLCGQPGVAEQRQWQDVTVGTSVSDPGNVLASK